MNDADATTTLGTLKHVFRVGIPLGALADMLAIEQAMLRLEAMGADPLDYWPYAKAFTLVCGKSWLQAWEAVAETACRAIGDGASPGDAVYERIEAESLALYRTLPPLEG